MIRADSARALAGAARPFLLGGMVLSLSACATTGPDYDPYESLNRGTHAFNEAVDEAVIKPAATLYDLITPEFVSLGVSNFFGNLRDIQSVLNDLLQGKVPMALEGSMRVAVNSTLGLAGLIDVGIARIRLENGAVRLAELHWYEAHGIGRREFKRKRYLDRQ